MFHHTSEHAHGPDDRCGIHAFDRADGRCRSCGDTYCADCLVYPKGPSRPPYCLRCALVAAGIRRRTVRGRVRVG
jgi:hypothetical protein